MSQPLKVLIIDDSEDDAVLLILQLVRDHFAPVYQVVDAEADLIRALEDQEWDIVISDYIMPKFGGLDVLRILKEKKPDIPCIIVSGKITDETAVAAMKAGARDYVMKDNLRRIGPAVRRELTEAKSRKDREKVEKRLYENEKLSSALLDNAPIPIEVHNPDHSIRYVNPAFEKLTGFGTGEVVGMAPPFIWWPADKRDEYQRVYFEGGWSRENALQKKSGEIFFADINSSPVKNEDGEITCYINIWKDITEHKYLREEKESFTRRLLQAQEEERKRIARELHDDAAQNLALLMLEVDSILLGKEKLPQKSAERLRMLKNDIERTQKDIRRYSHELRPGVLDYLGLEAALEGLVEDVTSRGHIEANLEISGDQVNLSDETELALFRIAQEAINNISKHSGATRASISLKCTSDKVRLTISDNGKGFELKGDRHGSAKCHLGITGMKERAQLIGAKLRIKSVSGGGTTIMVEMAQEMAQQD